MRGRSYVLWQRMKRKNTPFLLKWPCFLICDKLVKVHEIEGPSGTIFYMNIANMGVSLSGR